jgi:hypothetical protein
MNERGDYDNTDYGTRSRNSPPPGYHTASMPPAVKPKRTTPLWVAIATGAGGLVLGLAIGSGGKADTTTTPTGAGAPTQAGAAPSVPVQAAETTKAAPAPAKPAKTVVLTTSGNGIKETKSFTTGAEWSVTYTFNCSGFGSKGNFVLSEGTSGLDILANGLAAKGADTTYRHDDAGKHSLSVNSECDWTLKVTDGDTG